MNTQIPINSAVEQSHRHAMLAMQAAKKVRRARRQSQKEKMGREVCRHLLCLLNPQEDVPPRKRQPASETLRTAVVLAPIDEKQISLGF